MARRYDSGETKRRILAACARLFLEKGYTNTTVAEILKEADVAAGSFQNIFRTKDGKQEITKAQTVTEKLSSGNGKRGFGFIFLWILLLLLIIIAIICTAIILKKKKKGAENKTKQ